MSSDVGSFVRGEKCNGVRHVFGGPDSSQRNHLQCVLSEVVGESRSHGGFDEAWCYGVASYVARPDLAGDSHGQSNQTGFRRGIIGLSRLARLTKDRRYI